ncbi:AraC family transcriptional regulator [Pendulispora brunnea]|uniref:AraC family transcriptional regulator n=1 Tax=Pendulispora brunnea TaxID=2905690 RepID=A0ABZ2KN85_9BACT
MDIASAGRRVGLDLGLRRPVPEEQIDRWLAYMAPSLPSEFGLLLGAKVRAESLGLVGLAARFSRSLGAALAVLAGHTMLEDEIQVLPDQQDTLLLIRSRGDVPYARKKADCVAASILAIANQITGERLVPKSVAFAFPPPETVRYHRQYKDTFGCPIQFDRGDTCLVLASRDLRRSIPGSSRKLATMFHRHAAESRLAMSGVYDLRWRARAILRAHLFEECPTIPELALLMGVSERLLRRRLDDTSPRFLAIVDEVRKERAVLLLRRWPKYTNAELASMVGLDEARFSALFRRWTGMTPGQARQEASR